ncbi:hypothetical protein [Glycomyces tarimensis]
MKTLTAPPELDRGVRRNGVIVTAVFGFFWTVGGAGILGDGALRWTVLAAALAVAVGLIVAAVRVPSSRTRERTLPVDWGRRYNLWILFEVAFIAAAVAGLVALETTQLLPAVIAAIVAVHFLPLAAVFDEPKYRWTAYGMLAVAAAGLAALVGSFELSAAVVGFGSAAVLWATAVAIIRAG